MTIGPESIGYISGGITALCGLGLAIVRGRDREKQRQAILASKTPEQLAALDKLMPMLFRNAALLVVILGAALNASAPAAGSGRLSAAVGHLIGSDLPAAERPPACSPADCKPPATCTRDGCVGSAAPPEPPEPEPVTAARPPRLDVELQLSGVTMRDPEPALPRWAR